MSLAFHNEETVVWFPATRVAELFVQQVRSLELLARVECGLAVRADNDVDIDTVVMDAFLKCLNDKMAKTTHPAMLAMVRAPAQMLLELRDLCEPPADTRHPDLELLVFGGKRIVHGE